MIDSDELAAPEPPPERPETFVSVDVETSGSNPSQYSLLSIGACLVDDPEPTFYVELKPDREAYDQRALDISGLDPKVLAETGTDPGAAMLLFEQWVQQAVPAGHRPIFVAFNAPFDWMFVQDYFQRYLGRNPFGVSALDMKAYYMGMTGVSWARTSMRFLSPRYLDGQHLSHNALGDAQDQAGLFRGILAEAAGRGSHGT